MENTILITRYDSETFQTAFRAYFAELGVQVTNWPGLFDEMTGDHEPTLLRVDDTGRVIGFIMFAKTVMTSGFFEADCGFIREFWVDAEHRNKGVGSELLARAEAWLHESGCRFALLTTDTAVDFYGKRGWRREAGIRAKNQDDVYVKRLG